jgi:hypothetical protein
MGENNSAHSLLAHVFTQPGSKPALTAPERHFRYTPGSRHRPSIETPITLVIPITGVIEVTRITGVAKGLGWLGPGRGWCGIITDPWLQYLAAGNHFTKQNPYVRSLHPG